MQNGTNDSSGNSGNAEDPDSLKNSFKVMEDGDGPDVLDESFISEKADELKEHDVINEEIAEADRIEAEQEQELEKSGGWLKILGNDQIMKKILKKGISHKKPTRGEVCTIKIEGRLQSDDNVIFESNEDFTFQLGDAEVISGLDLAIPLMCKGESSIIKIAHRFGYGAKGLPPLVPPHTDLVYTIALVDCHHEKDLDQLSVCERTDIGNRKRERGNWWYGRGETTVAIQCYRRALEFLDDAEGGITYPKGNDPDAKIKKTENLRVMFEDRLKTYNNMAAAQLKLKAYQPALKSVEAVLMCQPKNVKALFRKGKILGEKGDTDEAIEVLSRASELEPENKAIILEIRKFCTRQKEEQKNEKLLYRRMFKSSASEQPVQSKSSNKRTFNIGLVVGGVIIALAGVMAYRYAT